MEVDRIPCPNDPKHTVDRKSLEQHLLRLQACLRVWRRYVFRCNSRVAEEEWLIKDVNAVEGETKFTDKIDRRASEEDVCRVVEKLKKCYESVYAEVSTAQLHTDEIEDHLKRNPELSDSKRKHLIQQSSIIGHLDSVDLLRNDPSNCIFELGAGKAQLAYWMTKKAPNAKFLLIDRSGSRNKYDNKALQENPSLDIKRLRCSIEHLDLSKVDALKDVSSLCAVCKHFCGSATDAGIRCLSNGVSRGLSLSGFVLVPCCHHKSRYSEYCGHDFLAEWNMDSEGDFAALRLIAAWAVSGITLRRINDSPDLDVEKVTIENMFESASNGQNSIASWSPHYKEELGRRAKIILEMGRARYLSSLGFNTRVIKYVPESVSPENLLILGTRKAT
ncbi:unnamed protein product [Cylicostephanus goldi]|uniref:tRNA:m(4)X modification enzyme TRM13 n=1 Tax=Cylicostephanus goldi TaxID=71465 RepID=A0A3P7LVT8_CYLGO|nr:unnamed protein product [Cylicostephanus goldi]